MKASPLPKLLDLARTAIGDGSFVKLTLSAPRGADRSLVNVHLRTIDLRGTPHLSFVYHHTTRDITKNFPIDEGLIVLEEILGPDFRNAHLFTTKGTAQLELRDGRGARLLQGPPQHKAPPSTRHDQTRNRRLPTDRPWLHALGVTSATGQVTRGMEAKYRQINKFIEVFAALAQDAHLAALDRLTIVDMGCGKGYLTFAVYDHLQAQGPATLQVRGIEVRPELVDQCNRIAQANQADGLTFESGRITDATLEAVDVLLALHACDTATDDAIARGIAAGARLILVSPCCHQELRPQLIPPPPLEDALRHGILLERHAEFVTDALRAALLEWAGYETRVFEFIATEHTAKNLMIAAIRRERPAARTAEAAVRVRALAAAYGLRSQRLATHLAFALS